MQYPDIEKYIEESSLDNQQFKKKKKLTNYEVQFEFFIKFNLSVD